MFECQFCKSSLFIDRNTGKFKAVGSEVCNDNETGKHQPLQSAEFYVHGSTNEIYRTATFELIRNGEMRYWNPSNNDTFRYTEDFIARGIKTDDMLETLITTGVLHQVNNPWFELFETGDYDSGEVFDDLNSALEAIVSRETSGVVHISQALDEVMATMKAASNVTERTQS